MASSPSASVPALTENEETEGTVMTLAIKSDDEHYQPIDYVLVHLTPEAAQKLIRAIDTASQLWSEEAKAGRRAPGFVSLTVENPAACQYYERDGGAPFAPPDNEYYADPERDHLKEKVEVEQVEVYPEKSAAGDRPAEEGGVVFIVAEHYGDFWSRARKRVTRGELKKISEGET